MTTTWTKYAREIRQFNWSVKLIAGQEVMIVPTVDGNGEPGRSKYRGGRIPNGSLNTYWQKSDKIQGLAGDVWGLDSADPERTTLILTGSETDALAIAHAAENEALPVRVICSCGETRPLKDILTGPWFSGFEWFMVCDEDETGRKSAPKRAEEILRYAEPTRRKVRVAFPPKPHKDARDYIESGGTLLELLGMGVSPVIPFGCKRKQRTPSATIDTKGDKYAQAVIRGELEKLASTAEGGRERSLIECAFNIGRKCLHVVDFHHAMDQLIATAIGIGLPEKEAADKAKRGLIAGQNQATDR